VTSSEEVRIPLLIRIWNQRIGGLRGGRAGIDGQSAQGKAENCYKNDGQGTTSEPECYLLRYECRRQSLLRQARVLAREIGWTRDLIG